MRYEYKPQGICAVKISFEVNDNKVSGIEFLGGCDGNHKGIVSLAEGMDIDEVIKRLSGITCGPRRSSCPDQLAKALESYKQSVL